GITPGGSATYGGTISAVGGPWRRGGQGEARRMPLYKTSPPDVAVPSDALPTDAASGAVASDFRDVRRSIVRSRGEPTASYSMSRCMPCRLGGGGVVRVHSGVRRRATADRRGRPAG